MNNTVNPELITDDNPEWTDEMFASAKQVNELPLSLQKKLIGRPRLVSPKKSITIRLDENILQHFKATGNGWQTRMNNALQEWIASH
ncbi:BrnA antitoxin family protein [Lonepinella sp. BR2357]|uniref:BrnA antitoxin family protein n=1 Tax=Lonepinella sp. BR2357 TaxID=3434549 RepID=UPI003F6E2EE1